jgi:hypothetical protein
MGVPAGMPVAGCGEGVLAGGVECLAAGFLVLVDDFAGDLCLVAMGSLRWGDAVLKSVSKRGGDVE